MNGTDLLAEFKKTRSETAFRELVRQYTNLVYSAAKRRLVDVSLAQEVTQLVFIRLANAVPDLHSEVQLVAWLHRTAVYIAINLWRSESRRRAREEHAAAMQPQDCLPAPTWNEISPVLDEALNELTETDRQVLLLRYFDEKSMRDVGGVLGISEDAAKMRVSRAVERLREQLSSRGVTCSALVLTAMLVEHAIEAAPAALVTSLALLRVPAVVGMATTGGILTFLANLSKWKLTAGVTVALSGLAIIWFLRLGSSQAGVTSRQAPNLTDNAVAFATNQQSIAEVQGVSPDQDEAPNPISLIHTVLQARKSIRSGLIEFDAVSHWANYTNQSHLKVVFDGDLRRFEKTGFEYAYVGVGEVGESNRTKIEAARMSREEAVKAGLLDMLTNKTITIYDGIRVLQSRESNGRADGASIYDAKNYNRGDFLFDPRSFGLICYAGFQQTFDSTLNLKFAKSVKLIGKEMLEKVSTWHVRIDWGDIPTDLWIEVKHPERLRKLAFNTETVISRFDESHPSDPIPIEVRNTSRAGDGSMRGESRLVRTALRANLPIDPVLWTLAGLELQMGTDVSDNRISRMIGYWDGAGLTERLMDKSKTNAPAADSRPDLGKLYSFLGAQPSSSEAFEAANWIILNTPDGPEVDKAAEVLQKHHLANPDLVELCRELQRFRHNSSRKLLETILARNPNKEVCANACFTLATLLKDQAAYGKDPKATADAEKYFDRAIKQYGDVKIDGKPISKLAAPELSELRSLIVGKLAPETEGKDFSSTRFRLSEYRGKTVILVFWTQSCPPEFKYLRDLLKKFEDKSVVVIGVNCDRELEKAIPVAANTEIPWRSFHDGRDGPISKAWNNDSWANYNIIDSNGIIKARHLWYGDIEKELAKLLGEPLD